MVTIGTGGFSWCYLILIVLACLNLHVKHFTPRVGGVAVELGYLALAPGLILSGILITIDSWVDAVKTKRISSMAIAGWNTAATINNVYEFASNAGGIFDDVFKFFTGDSKGKDKDDDAAATIVLAIVALSVVAGFVTTAIIVGKSRASELRSHVAELQQASWHNAIA